jgi:hypothetical protein
MLGVELFFSAGVSDGILLLIVARFLVTVASYSFITFMGACLYLNFSHFQSLGQ